MRRDSLAFLLESDPGTIGLGPWISFSFSFFFLAQVTGSVKDKAGGGSFCCVKLEHPLLSIKRMTVKQEAFPGSLWSLPPAGVFPASSHCLTLTHYMPISELGRDKGIKRKVKVLS